MLPDPLANHCGAGENFSMGMLDEMVMRTALIDARRYVARGLSIDEAVQRSCTGAWSSCCAKVAQRLRDECATAIAEQDIVARLPDERAA